MIRYTAHVLSADHNNFWQYLGKNANDKIEYFHSYDFHLNFLKDGEIEFVFSYDVFCHISFSVLMHNRFIIKKM